MPKYTDDMAGRIAPLPTSTEFDEIIKVMWGTEVKEEVFKRWMQGV